MSITRVKIFRACICDEEVVVIRYGEPEWVSDCLEENYQDCVAGNGSFFLKATYIALEE